MNIVTEFLNALLHNKFVQAVIICVVLDTIFGILRAIKEHKFNSCFGIDGAIRKCGMLISLIFMMLIDTMVQINLIGFIPENARKALNLESVGICTFFALLYIAYEIVSILKNMTLCGLPVKIVWQKVRDMLLKYTNELPDNEEDVEEPTEIEKKQE